MRPEALSGALPGYEIAALLGRGGTSAVYKGIQTSLERDVAIKLLSPELSAIDQIKRQAKPILTFMGWWLSERESPRRADGPSAAGRATAATSR